MRIYEAMTDVVHAVAPDESAERAWEAMRRKGVRHLVVTEGRKVIGVYSDSDAGGRSGAGVRSGRTVGELMDPHVVSVGKNDTVRKAANLMRGHSIGCLPVMEGSRLVGVITVADMLAVIGHGGDRPVQGSRAATRLRRS